MEIIVNSGDIANIGRYKGKKSPFGIGIISFEFNSELILEWSTKLKSLKKIFKECKVDEIIFDLEADSEELESFNISPELAKNLSDLNADFNIKKNT